MPVIQEKSAVRLLFYLSYLITFLHVFFRLLATGGVLNTPLQTYNTFPWAQVPAAGCHEQLAKQPFCSVSYETDTINPDNLLVIHRYTCTDHAADKSVVIFLGTPGTYYRAQVTVTY